MSYYYIYSRKSKYTGKGESVENQIKTCKKYILSNINSNIDESEIIIYEDEGFSGKNFLRPQFKKMLSDLNSHDVKCIVCYRLDRISRNVSDFSSLITKLDNKKISFISVKEQFDTSTPMGRAMMYIASVFAQLERETIAERIRDNMMMLSKSGRWLGGTCPTGFKSEKVSEVLIDGKSKYMFKLKSIPSEIKIIRTIYNKFIETQSLTQTETYLIQNNILSKNNKMFTRFTIKNILQNPVYMVADKTAYNFFKQSGAQTYKDKNMKYNGKYGIMSYNKTLQKGGSKHYQKDIKDWIISVGKHKGIIESDKWIKVQKILQINTSKAYKKPKSNVALLSGVLFCGLCGNYMRPKCSKRKNQDGEYIYSYICSLKEKSRRCVCNVKNINGNLLDKKIWQEIKNIKIQKEKFLDQILKFKKTILSHKEYNITNLKRELHNLDANILTLIKSISPDNDSKTNEYITHQINILNVQKSELKQSISLYEKSEGNIDVNKLHIKNILDNLSIAEKRDVIKLTFKKIVWDEKKINIVV